MSEAVAFFPAHLVRRGVAGPIVGAAGRTYSARGRPHGRASGNGPVADTGAGGPEAGTGLRLRPVSLPRVHWARKVSWPRRYLNRHSRRCPTSKGFLMGKTRYDVLKRWSNWTCRLVERRSCCQHGSNANRLDGGEPGDQGSKSGSLASHARGRLWTRRDVARMRIRASGGLHGSSACCGTRIARCLLRETGRTAARYAVGGWRQWRHLSREVKKLFNKVRSTRRAQRHPERVEAYVRAFSGRWHGARRDNARRVAVTRAWGNRAVGPSPAMSSLTPGGRLTMWSGVFCAWRDDPVTRRRSFRFSRNTRQLGFQRQGGHAG